MATLKVIQGSDLPMILLRSAAEILNLAGDHGEQVLLSRLTSFAPVEGHPKYYLDLPKQYRFEFESFCVPPNFDPENPEYLIRRLDAGVGDTQALLEGEIEGSFSDWNVIEYHGTAIEVGLPDEAFERLAEELTSQRIWEIEEYLGQGNGIPLGLSAAVMAIYARISKHGNDNLEEFAR